MTPKQEALALLALDELTWMQELRLNSLTAKQAGYEAEITTGGYLLNAPRGGIENHHVHPHENAAWEASPEFATSVDACLTLRLSNNRFFTMTRYADGATSVAIFEPGGPGYLEEQIAYRSGKCLPLDLLYCWWSIQPDATGSLRGLSLPLI